MPSCMTRVVHDHPDRPQIRLFTFLVGQQELLAVKTAMQRAKKTAFRPDAALWNVAVRSCGHIQSRQATSQELAQAAA